MSGQTIGKNCACAPLISVVIPVYKAEGCLHELYRRLVGALDTITENYEIILVEDCGGDLSWQVITDLAREDYRIKGIQFSRNFGQHYGITAGIDHSSGDWLVVMDCDLQDRPEEIPRLFQKAQEGFDVVLANRGERKDGAVKRITSWIFYKTFNYFADIKHDGRVGNFRIVSRKVVDVYREMREQLRFFGGIIDWMGFPVAYIDVSHEERFSGKTSYTYKKLLKLATDTIIAYSDKPLHLAIRIGFFMSAVSILFGLYIFYRAIFQNIPVLGWSSIIVSLYFIGGIIIAVLGVIGLYIGRTFDECKKRPLYVVNNKIGL